MSERIERRIRRVCEVSSGTLRLYIRMELDALLQRSQREKKQDEEEEMYLEEGSFSSSSSDAEADEMEKERRDTLDTLELLKEELKKSFQEGDEEDKIRIKKEQEERLRLYFEEEEKWMMKKLRETEATSPRSSSKQYLPASPPSLLLGGSTLKNEQVLTLLKDTNCKSV